MQTRTKSGCCWTFFSTVGFSSRVMLGIVLVSNRVGTAIFNSFHFFNYALKDKEGQKTPESLVVASIFAVSATVTFTLTRFFNVVYKPASRQTPDRSNYTRGQSIIYCISQFGNGVYAIGSTLSGILSFNSMIQLFQMLTQFDYNIDCKNGQPSLSNIISYYFLASVFCLSNLFSFLKYNVNQQKMFIDQLFQGKWRELSKWTVFDCIFNALINSVVIFYANQVLFSTLSDILCPIAEFSISQTLERTLAGFNAFFNFMQTIQLNLGGAYNKYVKEQKKFSENLQKQEDNSDDQKRLLIENPTTYGSDREEESQTRINIQSDDFISNIQVNENAAVVGGIDPAVATQKSNKRVPLCGYGESGFVFVRLMKFICALNVGLAAYFSGATFPKKVAGVDDDYLIYGIFIPVGLLFTIFQARMERTNIERGLDNEEERREDERKNGVERRWCCRLFTRRVNNTPSSSENSHKDGYQSIPDTTAMTEEYRPQQSPTASPSRGQTV